MLGNFSCFLLLSADFFQMNFFYFYHEQYQRVKWFGSRSGPTLCRSYLGSNCLRSLSVDDKVAASKERVKSKIHMVPLSLLDHVTAI